MCVAYVMPGLAEVWAVLGICFTICVHPGYCNRWADWWDYNGISGPQFWGLMNPGWILCSKGRNQSPIDIDPSSLLFDPSLTPLYIQGDELSGTLQNNGHDVTFYVNHSSHSTRQMTVTSGPLSYTFRVDRVRFHFGRNENESGSEHTVGGQGFLVEMQILAFNSELYPDFKTAEHAPHGLLAIAVFARLSHAGNREFDVLQRALGATIFKGDWTPLPKLRLGRLLPVTDHYVTYQGSLTYPGCHETVTWLIYNRPVYISQAQLAALQVLRQDTRNNPVMLMGGNIRPQQQLHQRTIRTNINFRDKKCSMARTTIYQVNEHVATRDLR